MSQLPPPKLSRQYLPLTRCTPCIPRVLCCSKHFDAAVIEYEQQGPLYQSHAGSAVQDYCTLVTQCSLDRWPRFTQQAEAWDGPVSVAVYIPTLRTSASARIADQLLQGYCEQYTKQHPTQCVTVSALYANHFAREGASALQQSGATDSSIRVQHSAADLPTYDQLYPINALRNLALQQASSPLILTADADLIPSSNLHRILQQPSTLQLLGHDIYHHHQQQLPDSGLTEQQPQQQQQYNSSDTPGPVMLVLPVFEMSTQQEIPDTDTAEVPRTKAELVAALTAGTAQPFHCGVFAPSHQPVDLQTWLAASEVYEVQYVEYFEPQGVAVKQQLPAYDERFRGYGLNKVQHAWHMNALGYRFKLLPDAFMVTSPHKRSSSWRPLPGTARDEAHLARITDVYEMFKQDISDKC